MGIMGFFREDFVDALIEVWLWKVLLSQHFQFKRFQDEKMESSHFPHADIQ